ASLSSMTHNSRYRQSLLAILVRLFFLRRYRFRPARGLALGSLCLADGLPEVAFVELATDEFVEVLAERLELIGVGQQLSAAHGSHQQRFQLLGLLIGDALLG